MIWNAMVVRTVNKKELSETPGAMLAMDTEYNKLDKKGVWDLTTVREKSEVMSEASRRGVNAISEWYSVFAKNWRELKRSDPGRKWKG
eukprot:7092651-Heterocapsa_arctica.AAC.1